MSSNRQSRDWRAVYQEYCASGLSVEKFSKTIGVSGSWVTENFRRLSKAGEIVYPIPKESAALEPTFMPLTLTDAPVTDSAGPDDKSVLKVTTGKAVIEIPTGISEKTLKSVMRIACEIC